MFPKALNASKTLPPLLARRFDFRIPPAAAALLVRLSDV
jgi:hypothetical protein